MLSSRGAAAVRHAPVDATLDGEERGDPLQGLERDRGCRRVMHVVELAAEVAPTGDLNQLPVPAQGGRPVESVEPGITVGMQKAAAFAE